MGFGDYPKEYNAKVHGPYNPALYYGKPDTKLADVRVGDLGSWLLRRNKSPGAIAGGFSRAYWRWQHKYWLPKYTGIAPVIQICVVASAFFYTINYGKFKAHRMYKHHW